MQILKLGSYNLIFNYDLILIVLSVYVLNVIYDLIFLIIFILILQT